ncbi:MAG: hypothetical protein QN157_08955 [Armatimonadota bacterium]|nr:hypothetical protein [Armatimonadota bacterium]
MRRVYLAAPCAEYAPDVYRRVTDIFRRRGAEVVSSRDLFPTPAAWQRGWRQALDGCTDLLVLLGPQRVLGAGSLLEVVEARAAGKGIWFAQPTGAIRPLPGVWLQFLPGRSRVRVAQVNFEPRRNRQPPRKPGAAEGGS